jgi:uncharacterized membrane protein
MSGEPAGGEIRRSPFGPFRVRGRETTRLEAFSDAVFGFSATLLVVSLEVPQTFTELAADLRGFAAFGLSFLALVFIWLAHRGFFRRYGLSDSWITFLNMVLLFVVLFFVYPLKFLSISFVEEVLGVSATPSGQAISRFTAQSQVDELFVIYGLGFAAVFLCIALFYRRALALREMLELSELEVYDARSIFWHYMLMILMALVSVAISAIGVGMSFGGIAGWIYGLLGPIMTVYWMIRAQRRERMERSHAS